MDDVRGIGQVVAQTTEDPIYGDTVQIEDILLMDVGAQSSETAMDAARGLLERRGWVLQNKIPDHMSMESTRWKDTSLIAYPFRKTEFYEGSVQQRIAEEVHVAPTEYGRYVLVVVSRAA